jgi:hypothetical protein
MIGLFLDSMQNQMVHPRRVAAEPNGFMAMASCVGGDAHIAAFATSAMTCRRPDTTRAMREQSTLSGVSAEVW